jgi:hypothetical protein
LTVSVFAVMHRRPVRPVRDDTVSRSDPSPVGACPAVLADRHRVVPGAITGTWLRRATAAGRLQHRLPLAGKGRGRCCCARTRRPLPRTWRPARWPARPAGRACCGPGGYGRERVIRLSGGERRRLRARRGRCRACSATHLLIPSWAVPRRADGAGVIARATARSVLHGTGTARLGAELGVRARRCGAGSAGSAGGPGSCSRRPRHRSAAWSWWPSRARAAIRPRPGRRDRPWATRSPPSPRARWPRSAGTATPGMTSACPLLDAHPE